MKEMKESQRLALMEQISHKRRTVETAIASVVTRFSPAMFLWGAPGLGKSHTIKTVMDSVCGTGWIHHTAGTTPKGLFLSLLQAPDETHVYEDCEMVFKTELSSSILRAACGSPDGGERWVTYESQNAKLRFAFTGGIIIASNANLARQSGPMQGVASRFRPIKWELTHDEVIAVIHTIARNGYNKGGSTLTPKECKEVATSLLDMLADGQIDCPLDIRLYTEHALPAFLYCQASGQANWKDVLQSKMTGTATTQAEGQAQRTRRLEDLALQLSKGSGDIKSKVTTWKMQTGLGQAIYYRHLRNAKNRK
jgi:hypothetical protein